MSDDAIVTFVVPSRGRMSVCSSVKSLIGQTEGAWRAVVGFDGEGAYRLALDALLPEDERVTYVVLGHRGSAGLLRNDIIALSNFDGPRCSRWIGFLDDDDELTRNYVSLLSDYDPGDCDVVVFRMHDHELGVLPDLDEPRLEWGQVGVSFAVSSTFLQDTRFVREEHPHDPLRAVNEDITFLRDLMDRGARVRIDPHITYLVRP